MKNAYIKFYTLFILILLQASKLSGMLDCCSINCIKEKPKTIALILKNKQITTKYNYFKKKWHQNKKRDKNAFFLRTIFNATQKKINNINLKHFYNQIKYKKLFKPTLSQQQFSFYSKTITTKAFPQKRKISYNKQHKIKSIIPLRKKHHLTIKQKENRMINYSRDKEKRDKKQQEIGFNPYQRLKIDYRAADKELQTVALKNHILKEIITLKE
ncbi:hypothetical protein KAH94_04725 [bacterium]|nr:hypothetical protein [bacterium]